MLREGPGGDQLKAWPKEMRVFARRERPHPGARLSLLETAGGRVHARAEDVIRAGKNAGPGHFPAHDCKASQAWPDAAMTACILLARLKLTAPDGELAKAGPKALRCRLPHAAARLVRGGRRGTLKIAAAWPWPQETVTAWQRVQTIPHPL